MSEWRDRYKIHPAAEVFPMMLDDELAKLGEDIKANGLTVPLTIIERPGEYDRRGKPVNYVLDGRNRLDAMERAGMDTTCLPWNPDPPEWEDAAAFIISANVHRRHLKKHELADWIAKALAADKLGKVCHVSKGGRGKANEFKQAVIEEAKKHNIGERTARKAAAKVEGREPRPTPKRSTRPSPDLNAAREAYATEFAKLPVKEFDAERERLKKAIARALDARGES
jgi:hypothetical protein